jgi:carbon storage regulator
MLVLTRKVHQRILIRDDIVVHVLGVERGRVKIGVSAPPDITILREELSAPGHRAHSAGSPYKRSDGAKEENKT